MIVSRHIYSKRAPTHIPKGDTDFRRWGLTGLALLASQQPRSTLSLALLPPCMERASCRQMLRKGLM